MASRLTILLGDLRNQHHDLSTQLTTILLTLDIARKTEEGYSIDEASMHRLMEALEASRDSIGELGDAISQLEKVQAEVEKEKARRPGTTDRLTLERLTREI